MAADLPENYEKQPAFQFIRDVAVDWAETRVLDGRIGDYVVVARQERGGQSWYMGAITDEEGRTLDIPLSFLPKGRSYVAAIYADGPGAHWLRNPLPVAISKRRHCRLNLRLVLAPWGQASVSPPLGWKWGLASIMLNRCIGATFGRCLQFDAFPLSCWHGGLRPAGPAHAPLFELLAPSVRCISS